MSTLTFRLDVEATRVSGLFASLDELETQIIDLLNENDGHTFDGLGATGESTYSIETLNLTPLVKADGKALRSEYEEMVRTEAPTDSELKTRIKKLNAELTAAKNRISDLERARDLAAENVENTRIFQNDFGLRSEERVPNYLKDGRHDSVTFQLGDRWDETISVSLVYEHSAPLENRPLGVPTGVSVRSTSGPLIMTAPSSNVFELMVQQH